MSKNLCSKRASEGATETREDGNESIQEFEFEQERPHEHSEQVAAAGREIDCSMQRHYRTDDVGGDCKI